MSRRSLGELFQTAVARTGAPIEPRPETSARPPRRRSLFVYALGGIGGSVTVFGFFLLYMYVVAPAAPLARGTVVAAACLTALGALALTASWVALLGSGRGGIAPILGSLTAAVSISYATIRGADDVERTAAIIGLSFATFALGHAIARGVHRAVRIIAVLAAGSVVLAFAPEPVLAIGGGTHTFLFCLAFGLLTAVGALVGINLFAFRGQVQRRKLESP